MNEIEVAFRTRIVKVSTVVVPDRRYRILVTLMRSDRPRYWNFLCHNCGSKIVELMNEEVIGIDDFFDPQNPSNHGVGRHCKGIMDTGLACPYSYYFQLSA